MQIGPQLKGLLGFRIRGFEVVDDSENIFDPFRVFASWGASFTANHQNSKYMRMNIEVKVNKITPLRTQHTVLQLFLNFPLGQGQDKSNVTFQIDSHNGRNFEFLPFESSAHKIPIGMRACFE